MITVIHGSINTPIELKNAVYTIVCESPELFTRLAEGAIACSAGESSDFVFSEKGKEIKISSIAETLVDFFSTDAFTKKINATLLKRFSAILMARINEVQNVFSSGYAVMQSASREFDVPVELKPDCDIPAFIKMYSPSVALDTENLLSRLIDYINVSVEFVGLRVLIPINLKCYLNKEDFILLTKHCEYKGVTLMCLEARETYRLPQEDILIIDKDLCEILVNSD